MLVKTPFNSHFFFFLFFFSLFLIFPSIYGEIGLQSAACIQMPELFPFTVRVQRSEKQQVSNCCVLKSVIKKKKKKMRKNMMETKTWRSIYKTDTTQDLQ